MPFEIRDQQPFNSSSGQPKRHEYLAERSAAALPAVDSDFSFVKKEISALGLLRAFGKYSREDALGSPCGFQRNVLRSEATMPGRIFQGCVVLQPLLWYID